MTEFTGKTAMRTALVLGFALFATPCLADDFQTPILAAHNAERAQVGTPPLVWDDTLAAHAAVWAQRLAQLGRLEHSANADRPGEGENLWMGSAGGYSPAEMVAGWAGEKADFSNGTFPDVARSGNWQSVGHYTQMIWRATTAVGCAKASSAQADILVCRYAPAGNFTGEKPF